MEKAKKALRTYSWVYVILAVFVGILAIAVLTVPEVLEAVEKSYSTANLNGVKPETVLCTTFVMQALVYLWYFWLLRRVANGKSNGTLLMVLLIIGIICSVFELIGAFQISALLKIAINAWVLYLILKIRNADE